MTLHVERQTADRGPRPGPRRISAGTRLTALHSTAYRWRPVHIGMDGNIMFHMSRSIFIICIHIPSITFTSSRKPPRRPTTSDCWKYSAPPGSEINV
ncbi:Uncharacterised protein [Nocardia cyriacigeorgica]|uniref:Uncharacterized protein n=1 Tax=Nocardia cyriacigeorgica TaxID=135487 RepID=A0A4U8VZE2_9NOCA|nr:Uncharacterised protein [Nocardia cyriacigeorgica]